MKRIIFFWVIGLNMSITALLPVSKAGLISVIGGTDAPTSVLGPYAMTSFTDDLRQVPQDCTYVTSPFGQDITFSIPMKHFEIPENWFTWSHDYSGDTYWTGDNNQLVNVSLPSETAAFYFYAQPDSTDVHTITAVAFDGISDVEQISIDISGNGGASYFGFYGTDGTVISQIKILSDSCDFAIGEFGISIIPSPEALLLGNIGLGVVYELKRQHLL